jgi:hypothetical protein
MTDERRLLSQRVVTSQDHDDPPTRRHLHRRALCAVALLIGSAGLIGGAARYAAVLVGRPEREVERATVLDSSSASASDPLPS